MKAVAEIGTWWVVLTGLYVTTLSTPAVPELVAGAGVALPCAIAARAARQAIGGAWRPRARWLAWPLRLPWPVVRDSAKALAAVFRGRAVDVVETVSLPREPGSVRAARQSAATVVAGCTPAAMVISARDDEVVVHRILPGATAIPGQVRR